MNAQAELDKLIDKLQSEGKRPSLLLHCCCGPCASYCIDYLSEYFSITALFFNPNIMPKQEYELRLEAFNKLLTHYDGVKKVILTGFEDNYTELVKGRENEPEGGERCKRCIEFRLAKTAEVSEGYDYFATTLTVSPHKDAAYINDKGIELSKIFNKAEYLPTDFKKKNGFLRSIELSKEYGLYRQNYCGCKFL